MNILADVPKGAALPRVQLLADAFPVVSQTFVVELAAALRTAGVPLHLLATGSDGADPSLLHGHPAGEDLARRMVEPAGGVGQIARFLARQTLQGRPPLRLMARAVRHPHHARNLLGRAAAFAQAEPVDVLHCQFATLGMMALRYRDMGILRFSRLVVHLRGWDVSQYTAQHGPDALARVFAEGDMFVANCRFFADRAIELGCHPDRVVVIGSPIDTNRFAPPATPRQPSGTLRVGAVGRLVEKKGFGDLIDGVAALRDRGVAATLDIIGEGPLRPDLEAQIQRHDLGDSVTLRGAAPSDAVLEMLHSVDLFVAPSVRAKSGDEDAPVNTLKEALATGLPVIGTRHGGIPELVEDGTNGFLVPERDPQALAQAMAKIAGTSAARRSEMGAVGREKVIAEYSRPVIAARTIDAYYKAIHKETRQ
ncbi:glycosyltransferase [uncultured Roseobacter sp.]|uniref:glycosyltransferase n=1 Tax=uncultured Roseobacter sp. TaxID=114847 RepID=UPI002625B721|nr:glycosyltransferase [uncultured Roseobacter sp.]